MRRSPRGACLELASCRGAEDISICPVRHQVTSRIRLVFAVRARATTESLVIGAGDTYGQFCGLWLDNILFLACSRPAAAFHSSTRSKQAAHDALKCANNGWRGTAARLPEPRGRCN
jgi:hypothetical protein